MKWFLQEIMKKWYLEHQTLVRPVICSSEPAYYIIDCQISGLMTRRTGLKLRSDLKWIVNCKGQEISVGNCIVYNSPKKQSLFFHLNTFFGELITPQIFFWNILTFTYNTFLFDLSQSLCFYSVQSFYEASHVF